MKKVYRSEIIHTVVGPDTQFIGTLSTQGSLRIDGILDGEIHSQGEIHIGEHGRVKGNILGKRVVVSGEVVGNIEAINGLEISRSGRVYGDISGGRLLIEEGAVYKGKVNMEIIASKNLYEGHIEMKPKLLPEKE